MRRHSAVCALLAVVLAHAPALATEADVVLVVDTTATMFDPDPPGLPDGDVAALRDTWPFVMDTIEAGAGLDARYALILVNGDGGCTLAQDLSERVSFLAGPFSTFVASAGSTVSFSAALAQCAPQITFRPTRPRFLYLVTDTADEVSTLSERDSAVAALLSGYAGDPLPVIAAPNTLGSMPNFADLMQRGTCSATLGEVTFFVYSSTAELAQLPPPLHDHSTWPCAGLFADSFESGDVSAWSSAVP